MTQRSNGCGWENDTFIEEVSKPWNIFVYFFLDHLNGKTSVQK
jgi:hypothetical protein